MMPTAMRIRARNYENGEPICLTVEDGRIMSVEPAWPDGDAREWPYVAPGLFDLQINGHGGTWFSKEGLTVDEVAEILEPLFAYGITRLCPTLITSSFEALASGFAAIRDACEQHAWIDEMVPGCHLEGPYISREDGPRGAHPLEHVRAADWAEFERLQEISGNCIRLITLAPECEGAIAFISKAVAAGVVVSIGHTAAEPDQIEAAVQAGARLSTHLGNGAHGTIRRHPNYIWEQLGQKQLRASLITDGHHLPPSVVRSFMQAKGVENIIITCDAARLAGCPPGVYDKEAVPVEILEDGRLVIAGQRQLLAGSGSLTSECVTNAIDMANVSLREAIDMAGRHPARLLRFEEIRLRRGSRADLFLFHYDGPGDTFEVVSTIAAGRVAYGEIPEILGNRRSSSLGAVS